MAAGGGGIPMRSGVACPPATGIPMPLLLAAAGGCVPCQRVGETDELPLKPVALSAEPHGAPDAGGPPAKSVEGGRTECKGANSPEPATARVEKVSESQEVGGPRESMSLRSGVALICSSFGAGEECTACDVGSVCMRGCPRCCCCCTLCPPWLFWLLVGRPTAGSCEPLRLSCFRPCWCDNDCLRPC